MFWINFTFLNLCLAKPNEKLQAQRWWWGRSAAERQWRSFASALVYPVAPDSFHGRLWTDRGLFDRASVADCFLMFFVKFAGCNIKLWFLLVQPSHGFEEFVWLVWGSWLRPGWERGVISMWIVPRCSKRVRNAQYQGGTKSQCDILVTLYTIDVWMCMLFEGHVRIQDFHGLTSVSTTAHLELAKSALFVVLHWHVTASLRNSPWRKSSWEVLS